MQSTWDENLYTTRLDKSKAAISVAEAQRIADEIEGRASGHRHVAEERNARDAGLQEVGGPCRCASLLPCSRSLGADTQRALLETGQG